MQIIYAYLRSLAGAFSDPEFYRQRLALSIGSSMRWSFLTLFLATFTLTGVWGLVRAPQLLSLAREAVNVIAVTLPADASFEIDDNKLTVRNLELPVSVPTPDSFPTGEFPKRLLLLTDSTEGSDSLVVLSRETMSLQFANGAPLSLRYSDIVGGESFILTTNQARDQILNALDLVGQNLPLLLTGIALITLSANIISGVLTITLFSFLVQTIGWFWGIRLRYIKAFQLGLLVYPVALVVHDVVALLVHPLTFPITTMAYIGIVLLVFWNIRENRMSTLRE